MIKNCREENTNTHNYIYKILVCKVLEYAWSGLWFFPCKGDIRKVIYGQYQGKNFKVSNFSERSS